MLMSQSARNETHGYTGSFVSTLGTARPATCKTHAASNGGFQRCSFVILQSFHLIVIGRLGALRCLPVCGSAPRRNQQTCRNRRERLHNLWRAGLLRTMLSRSSRRLQPTCLSGFLLKKVFRERFLLVGFQVKGEKTTIYVWAQTKSSPCDDSDDCCFSFGPKGAVTTRQDKSRSVDLQSVSVNICAECNCASTLYTH